MAAARAALLDRPEVLAAEPGLEPDGSGGLRRVLLAGVARAEDLARLPAEIEGLRVVGRLIAAGPTGIHCGRRIDGGRLTPDPVKMHRLASATRGALATSTQALSTPDSAMVTVERYLDLPVLRVDEPSFFIRDDAGNQVDIDLLRCWKVLRTEYEDDFDMVVFVLQDGLNVRGPGNWSGNIHNHLRGIGASHSVPRNDRFAWQSARITQQMRLVSLEAHTVLHEIGHRWLASALFRARLGDPYESAELLLGAEGEGTVHWGEQYWDNRDGTEPALGSTYDATEFRLRQDGLYDRVVAPETFFTAYSDLELYLMGAMAPAEVGRFGALRRIRDSSWRWEERNLTHRASSSPAALAWRGPSGGSLRLFVVDDEGRVRAYSYDPGAGWSDQVLFHPTRAAGPPAAVTYVTPAGARRINVFFQGEDGRLCELYFDGARWSAHVHGWTTAGPPAAAAWVDAVGVQVIVLATVSTGGLGEYRYGPAGWTRGPTLDRRVVGRPALVPASGATGAGLMAFSRTELGELVAMRYDGAAWLAIPQVTDRRFRGDPAAARLQNGDVVVFARGDGGRLSGRQQRASDGSWADFVFPWGVGVDGDPVAVASPSDPTRLHVLVRATDGGVLELWGDNIGVSGAPMWLHRGGRELSKQIAADAPAAVAFQDSLNGPDCFNVFFRTADGRLLEQWSGGMANRYVAERVDLSTDNIVYAHGVRQPSSDRGQRHFRVAWALVTRVGAADPKAPRARGAMSNAPAQFHSATRRRMTMDTTALPRGRAGDPMELWYDGSSWRVVSHPKSSSIRSTPSVITWRDTARRVSVFARSRAQGLLEGHFNGSDWTWIDRGGSLQTDPVAVTWQAGGRRLVEVYSLDAEGRVQTFAFDGASWSVRGVEWPGLLTAPSVVHQGTGEGAGLRMFALDTRCRLVTRAWEPGSGRWSAWGEIREIHGTTTPSVVSWSDGAKQRFNVFLRSVDGELIEAWYDGSWHMAEHPKLRIDGPPSAVTFTHRGARRLNVFAEAAGRVLGEAWFDGVEWRYEVHADRTFAPPRAAALMRSTGAEIALLTVEASGEIRCRRWSATDERWTSEALRGVLTRASPGLCLFEEDGHLRMNVFAPYNV